MIVSIIRPSALYHTPWYHLRGCVGVKSIPSIYSHHHHRRLQDSRLLYLTREIKYVAKCTYSTINNKHHTCIPLPPLHPRKKVVKIHKINITIIITMIICLHIIVVDGCFAHSNTTFPSNNSHYALRQQWSDWRNRGNERHSFHFTQAGEIRFGNWWYDGSDDYQDTRQVAAQKRGEQTTKKRFWRRETFTYSRKMFQQNCFRKKGKTRVIVLTSYAYCVRLMLAVTEVRV